MEIIDTVNRNVPKEWDESWQSRLNETVPERPLYAYERESLKYLKDDISILEIGCGDGYFLKYITDHFKNITTYGVDISPFVIEYAKKTYGLDYDVVTDFRDVCDDKKYDVVMTHQVIEHIEKHQELIDKCMGVLKDDGTLLISSVTNKFNYDRFHLWCFSKEDFEEYFGSRFKNVVVELIDVPTRPESVILGVGSIKK